MESGSKARLLAAFFAIGMMGSPLAFADGNPRELTVHARNYQKMFDEASEEFNVPVELLQAIAYAETRWRPHVPKGQARKTAEPVVEVENDGGMPPSYGIMGLRDDPHFGHSLLEAAALIRENPSTLQTDTRANIRGTAALLAQYSGRKTKFFPLEDWEEAVSRLSGIPQRDIAQLHTHEILTSIRQGRESDQFKIKQRHVDMEKVYGKDKLKKLSARRITVEVGVPDPKISAPDFKDKPEK
ncbi:hypothetical protein BH11PSE11_BH11PSE11_27100 [soil metagenome]